jgi:hypothetical protein
LQFLGQEAIEVLDAAILFQLDGQLARSVRMLSMDVGGVRLRMWRPKNRIGSEVGEMR